jgi:hypothetical protein
MIDLRRQGWWCVRCGNIAPTEAEHAAQRLHIWLLAIAAIVLMVLIMLPVHH